MQRRYAKVSIPAALWERLGAALASHPELGYRSPSDAVTECVRRLVEGLEGQRTGATAEADP